MTFHVLFENHDWLVPLERSLKDRGLPYKCHFLEGGTLDLSAVPAEGVFLNRMSPSSHTRGHQDGVSHTRDLLLWLEAHGRRVINGSQAFELEISKVRQALALQAAGIRTPKTLAVCGKERLKAAARNMALPFITKHNQGGKGLGVQLFHSLNAFDQYVDGPDFIADPGGVTLLQRYIEPAQQRITRVEIIGDRFVYAMHSSTAGGFELCPADACAMDDSFCPIGDSGTFQHADDFDPKDPLVAQYISLMRAQKIDVAGIEFVVGTDGHRYTYDINGTTNFNPSVEAAAGVNGMDALVSYLVSSR